EDATLVADGFLNRLDDDDADVFNRVMRVNIEVALRFDREIDQAVSREQVEHVIEESNAGLRGCFAGAIEIERDANVGLFRLARNFSSAIHVIFLRRLFPPPSAP